MPAPDVEKRKRIMTRSMALGHCVCDPRKPCPCPELREQDVCACAGERMPITPETTRLTAWVHGAGCASKIAKADLDAILAGLPGLDDPRVLLGSAAGDDAGVILLRESDDTALVLTVDVFAPAADDPFLCGRIAAANALSDVYAMGGEPVAALSVIGFPTDHLPHAMMRTMLEGGLAAMTEAGVPVVGGHSLRDDDVKMGFAVVGEVPRDGFLTHAGAEGGDALVLTKPVGAGILAFAAQVGRAPEAGHAAALASMATLNRVAGGLLREYGAHAATDVTGFGLVPHLLGMLQKGGVGAEILFDDIPRFPGVVKLAEAEVLPGAVERNREAVDPGVVEWDGVDAAHETILFSPETSGGLLVALPAEAAERYVRRLQDEGIDAARIIGRIVSSVQPGHLRVRGGGAERGASSACAGTGEKSGGTRPSDASCGMSAMKDSERALEASTRVEDAGGGCCCENGAGEKGAVTPPISLRSSAKGGSQASLRTSTCCSHAGAASKPDAGAAERPADASPRMEGPDPLRVFGGYMAEVMRPGALEGKTKSLIALALSVAMRCEPCIGIHLGGARKAGASEGEVAEAVAEGIAFGGAAAAMGYREAVAKLDAEA